VGERSAFCVLPNADSANLLFVQTPEPEQIRIIISETSRYNNQRATIKEQNHEDSVPPRSLVDPARLHRWNPCSDISRWCLPCSQFVSILLQVGFGLKLSEKKSRSYLRDRRLHARVSPLTSAIGPIFRSKNPGPGEPGPYDTWTPDFSANFGFSSMASAQIAMDHFNERNPSVVPQLADLGNCSVYFHPQVVADTRFNNEVATEAVVDSVQRQCTADKQIPCGVVGPAAKKVANHVQSITGALHFSKCCFTN
jgi:hypothetical protein